MPHATPVRDKIKYIDQKGENSDFVHWIYRDYVRCSRDVSSVLYLNEPSSVGSDAVATVGILGSLTIWSNPVNHTGPG